jgi:hypothetical protein
VCRGIEASKCAVATDRRPWSPSALFDCFDTDLRFDWSNEQSQFVSMQGPDSERVEDLRKAHFHEEADLQKKTETRIRQLQVMRP